jgi:hypothetical protein
MLIRNLRASVAVVALVSLCWEVRAESISRFQQKEFAIGLWNDPPADSRMDAHYAEIAEANFTFLIGIFGANTPEGVARQLALCEKHRLGAIVSMAGQPPSALPTNAACWGYFLADEPGPDSFAGLRRTVDSLHEQRPGKLAFINLYPNYVPAWAIGNTSYVEHVSRFVREVAPDVLCMDHYPHFLPNADGREAYCQNLEVMRQQSLEARIPFWNFFNVLPFGDHSDPTEAQIRWQIYTSLAYGAKGVLYFCYWNPNDKAFVKDGAIITSRGKRTRHYEEAKRTNAALRNLGPSLMKLTSMGVYRCTPRDDPAAVLKGSGIRSLDPGDYLVGAFQHSDGRRAVLLNNYHFAYSAWPTVVFDAPTNSIVEISPATGNEISATDDSPDLPGFQVSLDAGQGRLFLLPPGPE